MPHCIVPSGAAAVQIHCCNPPAYTDTGTASALPAPVFHVRQDTRDTAEHRDLAEHPGQGRASRPGQSIHAHQ